MLKLFTLGLAGATGTLARYWLTGVARRYSGGPFPLGTLVVNLVGCFLIGFGMYLGREGQTLAPETRAVVSVGLIGGFTTFSAFGYETLELIRAGALGLAAFNVCGNVMIGICAVWFGSLIARTLGL